MFEAFGSLDMPSFVTSITAMIGLGVLLLVAVGGTATVEVQRAVAMRRP
jgi:hypothetical protein